ncbi:MAG: argininosuccinate lyase [Fimbriimonadaceae bacterium]|nr:argininosuccinate lyase [Fimbriimonadaceae bacterium]
MRKLWGGAFAEGSDALVDRFGQSIETDLRFWREDVLGSIAHARMLGETGILSLEEASHLVRGLETILSEGPQRLPRDVEDVHTAVEMRLGELEGEVAAKLHTARSRNDQVATDTRLVLRVRFDGLLGGVKRLQETLLAQGRRHKGALMPGCTHQQHAQPITLGYHLLAHFWALQRQGWRLENVVRVANYCPLGSAALAGTGFPIDRHATSQALGFTAPIPSALDATSDRSYVLDALHVCASLMLDLSRMAQELVVWSGPEFGFVRLADAVTTGSSIMPQKRNPDMAELVRGRAGRALGNWTAFAATMKALPLGYNRDTQDDKPGLFESIDLARDSLALVHLMVEGAEWQTRRMREACKGDFSTATDLADALAAGGMPFRQAHEVVGRAVRACIERGWTLDRLDAERLAIVAPEAPPEVLEALKAERSVRARESFGGTGPRAFGTQFRRAGLLLRREGFHEPY